MKKLFTGLFRAARKRVMVTDNDMGMFRDKLNELVAAKDSLSDEEIAAKVEELKGFTTDLPDGDDKAKLDRFLDDFNAIKDQDEATAKEAASMVADVFEKLDTAAMKDVPSAEPAADEAPEEEVEETVEETATDEEAPVTEEEVEAVAEETETPAEDEVKDDDPNPEYSLEEIYQFIKKRLAEDNGSQDEAPDVEEDVAEEEEEEIVTDNAPLIPVTMHQSNANKGGLGSMFAEIKKGER